MRTGSTVPSGWTVDPLRYWGVKVIGTGSPTYDVVYNYEGHSGITTQANLRLVTRNNLSDPDWVELTGTILDEGANTLTKTGETGTEYALASTTDPLPVELKLFTAEVIGNTVKLNWETETEVDNYGFEVQRSVFGVQSSEWIKIGFVEGHGNSNSPKQYSFTDKNPVGGSNFSYRLKQIDTDGKFEYSDVVEVLLVPEELFLSQNFPNPFNPSTTIEFSLSQTSHVTLEVFNTLGERVGVLASEELSAGTYNYKWDASNLTSGIYFYKLHAGDFIQTRKMILLK